MFSYHVPKVPNHHFTTRLKNETTLKKKKGAHIISMETIKKFQKFQRNL